MQDGVDEISVSIVLADGRDQFGDENIMPGRDSGNHDIVDALSTNTRNLGHEIERDPNLPKDDSGYQFTDAQGNVALAIRLSVDIFASVLKSEKWTPDANVWYDFYSLN
jgi:hypothetical protein